MKGRGMGEEELQSASIEYSDAFFLILHSFFMLVNAIVLTAPTQKR